MPLTVPSGDLFALPVQALVNPVNCVGVMGAGLAKQFREKYPQCFLPYKQACADGRIAPGRVFAWPLPQPQGWTHWILHFPTKRHWKQPSRMADIESGLADLIRIVREEEIPSIAIPPLGAGLGGLDPRQVHELLQQTLRPLAAEGVDIRLVQPAANNGLHSDKPQGKSRPRTRHFANFR